MSTTSVDDEDDEDDADDERPATVHLPCVAGETRACKIVWRSVDEPGVQHCRTAQQVCRDDGRGWRACGDVGEPE